MFKVVNDLGYFMRGDTQYQGCARIVILSDVVVCDSSESFPTLPVAS